MEKILKVLSDLGFLFKLLIKEMRENNRIIAEANKIPHKPEELPENFDDICKEPASVDELPDPKTDAEPKG